MTNPFIKALADNKVDLFKKFTFEGMKSGDRKVITEFTLDVNGADYFIAVEQSAYYGIRISYKTAGMWSTSDMIINSDGVDWNRGSGGYNGKGVEGMRNEYNDTTFAAWGLEFLLSIAENKELIELMEANSEAYYDYDDYRSEIRREKAKEEEKARQEAFDAKMKFTYSDDTEILKALRNLKAQNDPEQRIVFDKIDRVTLDMEKLTKTEIVFRNGKFYCYFTNENGDKQGVYDNGRTVQKSCVAWLKNAVEAK